MVSQLKMRAVRDILLDTSPGTGTMMVGCYVMDRTVLARTRNPGFNQQSQK
jgi:hypothetical protein